MSNLNMSQTLACAVAAGFALAPVLIGNAASHNTIFAPDAELKELFNGAHFTEGVSVAPDGTVYFSDITFTDQTDMHAGNIWKHNPETGETTIFRSPSGMSNGTKFDAQGRLVIAEGADFGGRRITRTDLTTGGKAKLLPVCITANPLIHPTIYRLMSRDAFILRILGTPGMSRLNNPSLGSIGSIRMALFISLSQTQANRTVLQFLLTSKPFM